MSTDYYQKENATVRVGHELQARGWKLFGYKEDQSDGRTDYWSPARWDGIATRDAYPGVVVVVNVSDYKVKQSSGKDQVRVSYEPGDSCAACAGTGVAPNALTWEQAQTNQEHSHRVLHDKAQGLGTARIFDGHGWSLINRSDYDKDGRPKCLECHGRGHHMREVKTVEFTWPTFKANPPSRMWHIEHNGRIIANGQGFNKCGSSIDSQATCAVKAVCDEIEAAAKRTLRPISEAATTSAADPSLWGDELATVATGGKITVYAEHDLVKGWTYIKLIPRIERDEYDAFRAAFNLNWHRMRRQPVLYRLVSATDLARHFGPVEGQPDTPKAQMPEAELPDLRPAPVAAMAPAVEPTPEPTPVDVEAPAPAVATLVDESAYSSFIEEFAASVWGSEDEADQAMAVRAAALEIAGWHTFRTKTLRGQGRNLTRVHVLKVNIPGRHTPIQFCADVSKGTVRPTALSPDMHLRFLAVRPGCGKFYDDTNLGVINFAADTDRYSVLAVLTSKAEALLAQIAREGLALSTTVYTSAEQAEADAQAALTPSPTAAAETAPATEPTAAPAPVAETAPATTASQHPDAPGNGRPPLFYEDYLDADWGTTPKARKAAEARAADLIELGWKASCSRNTDSRKKGYTVSARDPNTGTIVVRISLCDSGDDSNPFMERRITPESRAAKAAVATTEAPANAEAAPIEEPVAEMAPTTHEPTKAPATNTEITPIARIKQMRADLATIRAKKAQAKAERGDAIKVVEEETAAWIKLCNYQAAFIKAQGEPLGLREMFVIREWGDVALAKRARDLRARALRGAGWKVETSKADGAFYISADHPLYDGVCGTNGSTPITPANIEQQFKPLVGLAVIAASAVPVAAAAAPTTTEALVAVEAPAPTPEPINAATSDEAPRPLAGPTLAVQAAPIPNLGHIPPLVAPAMNGKGKKAKKGNDGPLQQLSLF
jgi:hypothetical protein